MLLTYYGAPDRTRTCYPRLRRPVLYPDELRARIKRTSDISLEWPADKIGRGDRIRTYDILVPNQARYRAALHPVRTFKRRRIIRRQAPLPQRKTHPAGFVAGNDEAECLNKTKAARKPLLHYPNWRNYYCGAASGALSFDVDLAGASSSAFMLNRTRPLSSASSTFTLTIWPSFK